MPRALEGFGLGARAQLGSLDHWYSPAQPSHPEAPRKVVSVSFLPFSVSYRVNLVPWDPREDPAPLATL